MSVFPSLEEYEQFVYSLPVLYPTVRTSTVVVIRESATVARVEGQILFDKGIVLDVWERLNFRQSVIQSYSYSVNQKGARLYWYDPQPHPNDPSLAATDPHHKHVPPDIKHHRIPAPDLSFTRPNLPFLIEEIERELLKREG
jgi:hypothetical protein